jgi:hypothetical protein
MARTEQPDTRQQPVGDRQMLAPQGPPKLMNQQQPVPLELRKRRRTFGDVLTGLAALVALAALVGAVPLALAYFVGWPLPHHMPAGNVLNSQITTQTYVDVLAVFVWIAWAQFTACVLVETIAAARGVGMPSHVPLSGGSQMLARQLVAAVLLITASAASFAPGLSSLGRAYDDGTPQRAQVAATAVAHGHQSLSTDRPSTVEHSQRSASTIAGNQALPRPDSTTNVTGQTKFYRVSPPQGRHHDSLWEIAQRHLGDGRRYQEIYDLNKDKVQPDGSTLTKASLIRPGWILEMPGDATGGDLVENPFNAHGAATPGLDGMAVRGGSGDATGMEIAATQTPASSADLAGARVQGGGGSAPGLDGSTAGGGAAAPGLDGSGGSGGTSDSSQAPTQEMQLASHLTGTDGGSLGQVTTDLAEVVQHTQTPPGDTARPTVVVGSGHRAEAVWAVQAAQQRGVPLHTPGGAAGAAVHESGPAAHTVDHTQAPDSQQSPFRLPYELMAAPLLAAGLLGALGRNRRRQLWNRALGRRLTVPGTDAAAAEEAIRLGAGLGEVRFLNRALRELAAVLTAGNHPLPAVYAARLTDEGLELLLSEPAPNAPAPWAAREDARAWFVPRAAVGRMDDETVARTVAPYPGLVSAGVSGPARILLDLEAAAGVISVDGDDTMRRAVLAAMAVELATNTWSDRMTVTLIGFPGDLTPLAPGRIRQAPSLDDVLPDLKAELDARRAALGQAGLDSVLSGRLGAVAGAAWPPHFIISAQTPSPSAAAALADITGGSGRIGVGYLIAGDVPGASWQLSVGSTGRLSAPLLDLDVDAQRLPDDQYAAVLSLFGATQDLLGVPMSPLTAEAAVLEATLRMTPTVSVRLIGELEVTGAGELEAERRALVTEALTFLMLHRDGVHPRVLASALWPRGVTNEIADSVVARLGQWLGTDPEGAPNLVTLPDGRYAIGASVRSDWEMFRNLRALADQDPRYQDPNNRDQLLGQALGLVRGPLLARREPGRYGWLAYESVEAEVPAVIADTAVELCELRLAAGNAEAAVDAVRSGMRGSPADEELWRALLRATHATGDTKRLADVIDGIQRQTQTIHGERGLHPKTEALVDELLPTWRTPATVGA